MGRGVGFVVDVVLIGEGCKEIGLRQSVNLVQDRSENLDGLLKDLQRHGGCSIGEAPQAAEVIAVDIRMLQQSKDHDGDGVPGRDLLLFDRSKHNPGVKTPCNHTGSPHKEVG